MELAEGDRRRRYKHTKKWRTIDAIERLYGVVSLPTHEGSPHEGEDVDAAECVLHELAHQTMLPAKYAFQIGKMYWSSSKVDEYLTSLHKIKGPHDIGARSHFRRDIHEVKAIAIELIAGRKLGLKLDPRRIIRSGVRNSDLFSALSSDHRRRFANCVRRAMRLEHVLIHAESIVYLVEWAMRSTGTGSLLQSKWEATKKPTG